ncbi:SAM-dependent methyltransferase [Bounagaea algeriensis]
MSRTFLEKRTHAWSSGKEAQAFFGGLELVDPGLVQVHHWHPEPREIGAIADEDVAMYGAVARKP